MAQPQRAIVDVAADLGLGQDDLRLHGRDMAKLTRSGVLRLRASRPGRLVLVSAITPTPAGEGKTTVSIGLGQGLRRLDRRVALALREPSLGPVFGLKGGGTGGGMSQLVPAARINLHFTGDLHAVTAAHNLLAALVDNALHHRRDLVIDPRRVIWRRVLDVNDRVLREVIVGLGGAANGLPRETAFDITAASEVMAVLSLAEDPADLKLRLGRMVVGFGRDGAVVTAKQVGAVGAMAALLHDAWLPNLVQSVEGVPAFVHGGPFGNIAHGCSSVLATRAALGSAEYAVTEAGFGFDLGAEKFFDIKCRSAGLWPHAVVLVVTVRALRVHGGGDLLSGLAHLDHHVASVRRFGLDPVVAINVFAGDAEADLALIERGCLERGLRVARSLAFSEGGAGCEGLARTVIQACDQGDPTPRFLYPLDATPRDKIAAIARGVYGASDVALTAEAQADLERWTVLGHDHLPICVAKTHLSLTDDRAAIGRPREHLLHVKAVRLAAGAGYLLALAGDILTMPGLPAVPAAHGINLSDEGEVVGL